MTIILPTWRPYEHSLNRIVKDILEKYTDYDYWLTFDDDNPPTKNPLDLVERDKDIIGFPTPVWANMKKGDQPYYYNALDKKIGTDGWTPASGKGLTKVDVVGSGCMLIHRRVLESMDKPIFMREYDNDGLVTRGHDYLFCENARNKGFEVWTHFDYPCLHFNETELGEQIRAFNEMKWQ